MEKQTRSPSLINNAFYDDLGERWYTDCSHPIALLKAENSIRNPWICSEIRKGFGRSIDVLDMACGAGYLSNTLAQEGHRVTGIDLSTSSLRVAQERDSTKTVRYQKAHVYETALPDASFDVVCAMDILEHLERPDLLIKEASRCLKPGGLFFFHTFNRNLLSYLLIIKGVEWFVPNAPSHMHVYPLFIKPIELRRHLEKEGLYIDSLLGLHLQFSSALMRLIFNRRVPSDLCFTFSKNKSTGYCGVARKL